MYHGQQLHLDHDDHDRSRYLGLSHRVCNLRAAAVKLNRMQQSTASRRHNPSRAW